MRSLLLPFTALTLLAATPAFAQGTYTGRYYGTAGGHYAVPPGVGRVVTGPPGLPSIQPLSPRDSNINATDTRTKIAPALPAVGLSPNASASEYLQAAQNALASGQTGRAQEALESAETRLLDRSVPQDMTNQPVQGQAIQDIHSALEALGSHNYQGAQQMIAQAIPATEQMETAAAGPIGTPMAAGPTVTSP